MIPVPWVLQFMGAAPWIEVTIGSVFGWAVLMLAVSFVLRAESDTRRQIA
jgi:hypothetical protein